jgi:hypothetical protein
VIPDSAGIVSASMARDEIGVASGLGRQNYRRCRKDCLKNSGRSTYGCVIVGCCGDGYCDASTGTGLLPCLYSSPLSS